MSFKENKDAFVVGDNVSKSLSPTIFKYWFSKYKILSNYTFLETNKNKAKEEILLKLKNKNIRGFNVTIPFKEFLLDFVHSLDPDAASIGAVNCVSIKNEQTIERTGLRIMIKMHIWIQTNHLFNMNNLLIMNQLKKKI